VSRRAPKPSPFRCACRVCRCEVRVLEAALVCRACQNGGHSRAVRARQGLLFASTESDLVKSELARKAGP